MIEENDPDTLQILDEGNRKWAEPWKKLFKSTKVKDSSIIRN